VLRDQPAWNARCHQLAPEVGIGQGAPQQARIVLEIAKAAVAIDAEEKAQPARGMAMIDTELFLRSALADRAETALRGHQKLIVVQGEAVIFPQVALLPPKTAAHLLPVSNLRIGGITFALAGQLSLAELFVLGVSLAITGELVLPVFRIFILGARLPSL
jgi:hypothetical protein